MPMSPARDEYVIAGDLTFHYVQWGERGSPIICVHGITANAFCFQALADELATEHRVIAYDLRGRGDSDKPESGYSIPIHAADLVELIDALELDRPVIIGHSLGAMIALHFAAHHPDKLSKLVLIDAGGHLPWNTPEKQPAWLTASIGRLGTPVASYEEYIQRLKAAPFLGPYWNEYLDIYFAHDVYHQRDATVVSKGYPAGVREDQLHIYEAFKPGQLWPRVQVPVLLLRAGQGLFTSDDQLLTEAMAEAIQQGIPNCHYINYPELNHYTIIFIVGDGVTRDIRNFLEAREQ
jgi:pimeloyl-ACP methyl ester carboxylesterase